MLVDRIDGEREYLDFPLSLPSLAFTNIITGEELLLDSQIDGIKKTSLIVSTSDCRSCVKAFKEYLNSTRIKKYMNIFLILPEETNSYDIEKYVEYLPKEDKLSISFLKGQSIGTLRRMYGLPAIPDGLLFNEQGMLPLYLRSDHEKAHFGLINYKLERPAYDLQVRIVRNSLSSFRQPAPTLVMKSDNIFSLDILLFM